MTPGPISVIRSAGNPRPGQPLGKFRARDDQSPKPATAQLQAAIQDREVIDCLNIRNLPCVGQRERGRPSPRGSRAGCRDGRTRIRGKPAEPRVFEPPAPHRRELKDSGVAAGSAPSRHANDARQDTAQSQAIHQRDQRPAVVVEAQTAGEEHHFDEIIHGSARPRQHGRDPPPKSSRRRVAAFKAALESMPSWFILSRSGIRATGTMQQGLSVSHEFTPDDRNGFSRLMTNC